MNDIYRVNMYQGWSVLYLPYLVYCCSCGSCSLESWSPTNSNGSSATHDNHHQASTQPINANKCILFRTVYQIVTNKELKVTKLLYVKQPTNFP